MKIQDGVIDSRYKAIYVCRSGKMGFRKLHNIFSSYGFLEFSIWLVYNINLYTIISIYLYICVGASE